MAATTVPVSSVGGWYDIFLPGQLRDFAVLQQAGRTARLTVGPWTHLSMDGTMMREALEFGLACARGVEPPPRGPVRLYVMGEQEWRDFESWPPSGYSPRSFYLGPAGTPTAEPLAADSAPDGYRYDPADLISPSAASAWSGTGPAGSTTPRSRPGRTCSPTPPRRSSPTSRWSAEVSAQIWFRSSLPHADVFVRLCDVDPGGTSWNVCDGLVGISDADQSTAAAVRLWPTAYRFRAGHRIRVQVSSGSFPRYARNPGTGEPRATAVRLVAADQSVHHDQERRLGDHPPGPGGSAGPGGAS